MSTVLQVKNLVKSYGSHVIFDGAHLTINERQKVGIIGRNGAGKSTLFKIIVGHESLDNGEVNLHDRGKIGYLTQHSDYAEDERVLDYLMRTSGKQDWECGKVAGRFQIKGDQLNAVVSSLAGGYQMRVKLISMLLKDPTLLLLDEPTNYLDLSTQILLEKFLKSYRGSFLLISHDREFIKRTCQETLEVEHGKLTLYPRPLEEYLAYKQEQHEMARRHNVKVETKKKNLQKFVDRFGAKASKASQAQSKLKQIARLKTIEILHPLSTTRIMIPKIEEKKGIALDLEDLEIGYPDKSIAAGINLDVERGKKIAVLGDNGQGKTTLLKTLAGELPALGGRCKWGHNLRIAYYAQHIPATLNVDETVLEYLTRVSPSSASEEDILRMAGNFLFRNEALKKRIPVLSGGEKARLCLAQILLQKNQVILLDEPTNHLDFETVEALARALRESNTTLLFVSHNRTFVEIVATGIIEVKNGKVRRYMHNYEDYVYHLEQQITQTLEVAPDSKPDEDKAERKKRRIEVRELSKQLKKIERAIEKLDKEKTELLSWFEENYNEFSEEKNKRLAEIQKGMKEKEEEWMELELKMESLDST